MPRFRAPLALANHGRPGSRCRRCRRRKGCPHRPQARTPPRGQCADGRNAIGTPGHQLGRDVRRVGCRTRRTGEPRRSRGRYRGPRPWASQAAGRPAAMPSGRLKSSAKRATCSWVVIFALLPTASRSHYSSVVSLRRRHPRQNDLSHEAHKHRSRGLGAPPPQREGHAEWPRSAAPTPCRPPSPASARPSRKPPIRSAH